MFKHKLNLINNERIVAHFWHFVNALYSLVNLYSVDVNLPIQLYPSLGKVVYNLNDDNMYMINMKSIKSKILPLSKQILIAIADHISDSLQNGSEMMPRYGINRLIFGDTSSFKEEEKFRERQRVKRAIHELRKRKFITARKQGEKLIYALTTKGTNELFLAKIQSRTKNKNNQKFCVISFDIPIAANDVRWTLDRFLKLANFKKLQQSVWYTDQDIFDETQMYIKKLKAENWIRVIKASEIK